MYRHLGNILHWPMIEIKPAILNKAEKKHFLKSFESADIIVLTSWYAAEHFLAVIASETKQSFKKQFKDKLFAVIGQRTLKALQEHDIKATVVSKEETAEGLFKAMTQQIGVKGKRILFPRSSLPNPYLKKALKSRGAMSRK